MNHLSKGHSALKTTALRAAMIAALGAVSANAIAASNFTMIDPGGGLVGGTNDVAVTWDGTANTNVASTNFNMTLASTYPFFGYQWTAHHIRVFGPGTYTIDTTCTTAQLEAGVSACGNPVDTANGQTEATRYYTFTVAPGELAAHMLFDWNGNLNIDVVDIWTPNTTFGPSPLHVGPAGSNSATRVWNLMSKDWNGDNINGGSMVDGPFAGFNANFNLTVGIGAAGAGSYTPTVNVSEPSNMPGCSISTKPLNVTERADWWLVAGFLAWLGTVRRRFKRQAQS